MQHKNKSPFNRFRPPARQHSQCAHRQYLMGSNLLNCHNSGWIKGKGLTYYSYRNKPHLLIGNSDAISVKQSWTLTATATWSLLPFHSFYCDIVLPKTFLPYPPAKSHAMAPEQYHSSQWDAVGKCCYCLVFPPSPQILYPFCLWGFFKKHHHLMKSMKL